MAGKSDFASTSALAATQNGHTIVLNADGAQALAIPLSGFLLEAEFHRHGQDLVLNSADGREVLVTGYFAQAHPPALSAPNGAVISADLATRLSGPAAPAQFAQANGATATMDAIGKVTKLAGMVEVRHPDGTTSVLHEGDPIYQGDVIVTKDDGNVGITFADNSSFALGQSGRIVIDELVYDPAAQTGQAALSVVKGTFTFVSGQIAKSAPDATTIKTPVMTIGIRGTTVAGVAAAEGEENQIALLQDNNGGTGQIIVTNSSGSMVLNTPNQLLTTFSIASAFPPPVLLSTDHFNRLFAPTANMLPTGMAPLTPPPSGEQTPPTTGTTDGNGQTTAPDPVHSPQPDPKTGPGSLPDTPPPPPPPVAQPQPPEPIWIPRPVPPVRPQTEINPKDDSTTKTGKDNTGTRDASNDVVKSGNDGGDSGDSGNDTEQNSETKENGLVIDGYVAGSTVFRDMDNDGELDSNEVYTTSGSDGSYSLGGSGGVIVAKGGTDTSTGQPLSFTMKAAAGSSVITPLTTLVVAVANAQHTSVTSAEATVKGWLGLPDVSLGTYNPVAQFGTAEGKAVFAATAGMIATVNALRAAFGNTVPEVTADTIIAKMGGSTALDFTDHVKLTDLITAVNNGTPPSWAASVALQLSAVNMALSSIITGADDFASLSSHLSGIATPNGDLGQFMVAMRDNVWDLHDASVLQAHVSVLKTLGMTSFTLTHGTGVLTAQQAAGLTLEVTDPATLTVQDTGDNIVSHLASLPEGCTAYVMTDNPTVTLTLPQAQGLLGMVQKAGGYTLAVAGTSGEDTLDLSFMFHDGAEWQLDYIIREGSNLKMVMTDSLHVTNTLLIVGQFGGNPIEFIADAYGGMKLVTGTDGTDGDDMFFTTDQGVSVIWNANHSGGQDEFFYGGGTNVFEGDGNGTVNFSASSSDLTMTLPLDADGNGEAVIDGKTQTFHGIRQLHGSQGNDVLRGPTGGSGNYFWIEGGKGNDQIYDGGNGRTLASYNNAKSGVVVDLGAGTATGTDTGNDLLFGVRNVAGSAFNDHLIGTVDNNGFMGSGGEDTIEGGGGYDTVNYSDLRGGIVADLQTGMVTKTNGFDLLTDIEGITGTDFNDTLNGGIGNDWFRGGDGADVIDGRGGIDTVSYRAYDSHPHGAKVNLSANARDGIAAHSAIDNWDNVDQLSNVENVEGSQYNDVIYGSFDNNNIDGGDGDDTIDGGGGNDTINGGDGDDTIFYTANSLISGGSGTDILRFGTGGAINLNNASGISQFEVLDLRNATVALSGDLTVLRAISSGNDFGGNSLYVLGDASDMVNFGTGWAYDPNPAVQSGGTFRHYTKDGFNLYVQNTLGSNSAPIIEPVPLMLSGVATRVSAFDIDWGDTLAPISWSNPAHGTVTKVGDYLTYTPSFGYTGNDSFMVTATDSRGLSTTITIPVLVGVTQLTDSLVSASETSLLNATEWTVIDNIHVPGYGPEYDGTLRVTVSLDSLGDGAIGSLRLNNVGSGQTSLTLEGTAAEINDQLAHLNYRAPGTDSPNGTQDRVNITVQAIGGVATDHFDIRYPHTSFTGGDSIEPSSWQISTNWSDGTPGTTSSALINGASATINTGVTAEAGFLRLMDGSLTVNGTLTLAATSLALVTDIDTTLTVDHGAVNAGAAVVKLTGTTHITAGTMTAGTVDLTGGDMVIDSTGSLILSSDSLALVTDADSTLTVELSTVNAGTGTVKLAGDTRFTDSSLTAGTLDLTGGDMVVTGTGNRTTWISADEITVKDGSLTVDAVSGVYTASFDKAVITIEETGKFIFDNSSSGANANDNGVRVMAYGSMENYGEVVVRSAETSITHTYEGSLANYGTMTLDQSLMVAGTINNYGTIQINKGEKLFLNGDLAHSELINQSDGIIRGVGIIDVPDMPLHGLFDNHGTIIVDEDPDAGRTLTVFGNITLQATSKILLDMDDSGSDSIAFLSSKSPGGGMGGDNPGIPAIGLSNIALDGNIVLNSHISATKGSAHYVLAVGTSGLGDIFSFDVESSANNMAVLSIQSDLPSQESVVGDFYYFDTAATYTGLDKAEVILGATDVANTIDNVGAYDIVHGGRMNDSIEVTSSEQVSVDGAGGSNTLRLLDVSDVNYSLTLGDADTTSIHVANIDTIQVEDKSASDCIGLTLDVSLIAGINRESALTVQFDGGSNGFADSVHLAKGADDGQWGLLADAATGTVQATNTYVGKSLSATFTRTDAAHTVLAVHDRGESGVDVTAQQFGANDIATATTGNGGGTDYVFGATANSNRIEDIGNGDYAYGGNLADVFYATGNAATVVGGAGNDILNLGRGEGDKNYDLAGHLSGIENINFASVTGIAPGPITLKLDVSDVASANNATVHILGMNGDTDRLELTGGWTQDSQDPNSYTCTANGVLHTVTVDDPNATHVKVA